ncbi:MAG: tRNA (adenosine(37)-N6)-dimethylallyltransferase MiaA [Alphaproteobacteria bacterium]|nr:tRNA (adenosine(37)-N6)-dimethylallyltransferase MiaA [Alphaproteobacteria bacterium]
MSENVIVIAGPTASGKSALSLDLAQSFNGVIINADASQVYQGIPIISAAPSADDKRIAEHRLYEYLDPSVNGNVFNWLNDAVINIREVWNKNQIPIIVGGGGLYLDNLIKGTTPIPDILPNVRNLALEIINQSGVEKLYEYLRRDDPKGAAMVNQNDETRVRRAWEIFSSTGKSISEWYKLPMVQKLPEARFITLKIEPLKKDLDMRCNMRFDYMLQSGAIDEVKYLISRNLSPELPAMRAKGVPELITYLKNIITLDEAAELAKLHTRQYAKRQLTWFRNKFKADFMSDKCYNHQQDFINYVKKTL